MFSFLFPGFTQMGRILTRRPVHPAAVVPRRGDPGAAVALPAAGKVPARGVGVGRPAARSRYQSEIGGAASGRLEAAAVYRSHFMSRVLHVPVQ
jgi:hypothetical protein